MPPSIIKIIIILHAPLRGELLSAEFTAFGVRGRVFFFVGNYMEWVRFHATGFQVTLGVLSSLAYAGSTPAH